MNAPARQRRNGETLRRAIRKGAEFHLARDAGGKAGLLILL